MERPPVAVVANPRAASFIESRASTASMKDGGAKMQLLSPSLQRGLRAASTISSATTNRQEREPLHGKKTAVFDFDSFTLEAVRRRHDTDRQIHAGSFLHAASAASSSGGSPRSPSMVRGSSRGFGKPPSLDGSMDDYDWSGRSTNVSTYSQSSSHRFAHLSSMSSMSKRMSVGASSTTSSALRSGVGGGSRLKHRAEVVVRGWLQRRRGRMLKRWKAQYCVLKTDQKLCLYASEDTVNGKLEGRFQVLRVTYNDRHGSFQVIGIGSDETPYKEEFRPLDEDGWRAWFQALREYFTAASMNEALERMPELSLVPGIHAALLEDDDDDDDGGDFAHEVEEMIMKPYAFGGPDERVSMSNTSSLSTASSSNQQQHHSHQRVHSQSSATTASSSTNASSSDSVADRKTVLFDPNDFPRVASGSNQSAESVSSAELPEYSVARASNYRKVYTGGARSKAASSVSHSNQTNSYQPAPDSLLRRAPSASQLLPPAPVGPVDCPMIERDSQNAMAILERCGSESVVSTATRDSDSAYSWQRA